MTGTQGQGEPETSARLLTAAERDVRAFELRKHGRTFEAIADDLGVTRSAAHKMVKRQLAKLPPIPEITEFRRMELERSEDMIAALWPRVEAGEPEAVRAVVLVMARRSRLAGADVLPSLNSVGVDAVQGALDAIVGMAVRLLAPAQRPAFMQQVETTLLQLTDGTETR